MTSIPSLQEIKRARKRVGLSQSELANMAGISQSHLAKVEGGKVDPGYGLVVRLFEVLDQAEKDECWRYMSMDVLTAPKGTEVKKVVPKMKERGFSQIPIVDKGRPVGLLTQDGILAARKPYDHLLVEEAMSEPALVPKETSYSSIVHLLAQFKAVLVMDHGKMVGIITSTDLIGHIAKR